MWNIFGAKISNALKKKKPSVSPKQDLNSKERHRVNSSLSFERVPRLDQAGMMTGKGSNEVYAFL